MPRVGSHSQAFDSIFWIRRHLPHHYVQWYRAILPLSTTGQPHEVEVRSLEFDIQLSTPRLIELLSEFEEHGIDLCQISVAAYWRRGKSPTSW